jgi:hypothetical protein
MTRCPRGKRKDGAITEPRSGLELLKNLKGIADSVPSVTAEASIDNTL